MRCCDTQEAHGMVHEANIKAAASEKALKEARMQVILHYIHDVAVVVVVVDMPSTKFLCHIPHRGRRFLSIINRSGVTNVYPT